MQTNYGFEGATYQAVGGHEGLVKLVDDFYETMETLPEAKKIRVMHPADLTLAADKLVHFLSGWMGGPRIYAAKFGDINIPQVHQHILIDEKDRDAWLLCMKVALAKQNYPETLQTYLMQQFYIPAERIRLVSQMNHEKA